MVLGIKTPKVDIERFTKFLTSPEIIVAASAILLTPLILKSLESIVARFPVFGNNLTIGLIIAAIVIFAIAFMVPAGMIRSVVLGLVAGIVITLIAPVFESSLVTLTKLR